MGRYFRRGKSKVLWLPAVADPSAITRIELDAGTDLSLDIAEVNGFELTNSPIPTPNLGEVFTPQIEGEDTTSDSSLTFYDRDDSEVIRTTLAKGTAGFLGFLPYGDVPTERMEVWEVKSNGVNDSWSVDNEAARFNTPFSISSTPEQDVPIPAAA